MDYEQITRSVAKRRKLGGAMKQIPKSVKIRQNTTVKNLGNGAVSDMEVRKINLKLKPIKKITPMGKVTNKIKKMF